MPISNAKKSETTLTGHVEKNKKDNNNNKKNISQLDTSKLRRTNRVIRSCSRCKKRKVKCNFEIPCDRCIARNQAHLCTRDPVIFDGLLISNDDKTELKYSKENEVLKKKIKELQDTILRLKSLNYEDKMNNVNKHQNQNEIDSLKENSDDLPKMIIPSYNKLKLNEVILTNKDKFHSTNTDKTDNSMNWNIYSSTVSILEKALTNGLILDNSNSSASEMDYNTEEWLTLNDKTYLKYDAEDSRSKCWLYELDLVSKLDKSSCDIMIKSGLKLNILFPIIDSVKFLDEYEKYWADENVKEKHISILYNKSASHYSLLGLMYALMTFGLYQCSEEDIKKLKFSNHDWDNYCRTLFSSSLESLYRSRYMTYTEVCTIQVISLLRILAGFLGGINLSNCLIGTSFFISYKLNLVKSKDPIEITNMWNTLAYDWYDDQDRYCLTNLSYSSLLQSLSRFKNNDNNDNNNKTSDNKLINWSHYYLMRFVNIAIIKKQNYYGGVHLSLKNLKKADVELRYIKVEVFHDIESYSPEKYPDTPSQTIKYIKYHLESLINHEMLVVNLKMSTFLSHKQWLSTSYSTCYSCALQVIEKFISNDIPIFIKSYPHIFQHVIYSIVFLIVDCMLGESHIKKQKQITDLTATILTIFKSFKISIRGAVRGAYVTEKLLFLMKLKRKSQKNKTENSSNQKNVDNIKYIKEMKSNMHNVQNKTFSNSTEINRENKEMDNPEMQYNSDNKLSLNDSTLELKNKIKVNNSKDIEIDPCGLYENKYGKKEENEEKILKNAEVHRQEEEYHDNEEEYAEEDEGDEEDEEDDVDLYYSTLPKYNDSTLIKFLEQRKQIDRLHDAVTKFDSSIPCNTERNISTNNETGNSIDVGNNDNQSHTISPQEKKLLDNSTTMDQLHSMFSPKNIDLTQLPIQNTIMDILEDSGWIQFINSIDDLNK